MMSKDILLFAGQGSSLSFDRSSLLSTSTTAARCLEAFHTALLSEFDSLTTSEKVATKDIISIFPHPSSLLDPSVQDNPVVQGIALYVHQLLDFISYAADDGEASHASLSKPLETAGFCSGILPAVVVALCPFTDSPEFLIVAVAGFRLAFWIGLRSLLFCRNLAGDSTALPWSLTIQGMDVPRLEKLLVECNQSIEPEIPLRISAILSERVISVAGPGHALNEFKNKHLPASVPSRFANIHGYYHGGNMLQGTLREILGDAQRRNIEFPSWDALRIPVRSNVNGKHLNHKQSSVSLLETMLENILIYQVDWRITSELLSEEVLERLDRDDQLRCNILALGPNSRSLIRTLNSRSGHPRLRIASLIPDIPDSPSPDDIAIVGMSVNYPSGKGTEQLWEMLENGLNVVKEIPSSRFQVSDYYDTDASTKNPRKMNAKHGNFLDDPFSFDNGFFQISPREAKSMDPQQRLLLHAALEAMEDAGYVSDSTPSFQKESTGVYVGVATLDYVDNTRNDIDVYYSPGTLRAFLSGRISYAFQLKGPSVVIDTACSSSTIALYQACRALQAGDCTSALAGGVNVISSPDMYLGLSRAHFLSSTGQCKPWDASADGYCRAEGCGLFVLKKLSDAVAENDRIYGVIRGIEVNQCGTAKSITHPDSETQAQLFKRLLKKTKINPDSIGVVEAHGTGTQAGDFAEVNSLQAAFGSARGSSNPLVLSSIKGNIGHAEAASGAAGLAKLVLMMQKQRVPPQAGYQNLNPRLATIAEHNIVIPTGIMQWKTPSGAPRRALLNNFGAAGSNAALILEEYSQPPRGLRSPSRSGHVLNLSAKTADALEKLRAAYCEYAEDHPNDSLLASLCYSTNARKQQYDALRLSLTAQSMEELVKKLRQATVPARVPSSKGSLMTFVFSGQGSVYSGMGAELLSTEPVFGQSVRLCNTTLAELGFCATDALIGQDLDAFSKLTSKEQAVVSQCACFVLEYSLARMWMAWGVMPDVVVGHSLGEYAALATAGVLSLRDALFLVARRASLMSELCEEESTGMVACNLSPTEAEGFLSRSGFDTSTTTVACKNSADDCVVAGPLASLKHFVDSCKASGIKAKLLGVPYGFHSAAMDPILDPFAKLASTVKVNIPKTPVASSFLGRLLFEGDINADYFVGHARQPVEFVRAADIIANLAGEKKMTFIEAGPAPITLPMLRATLKQTEATFLPSLKPKEKPWVSLSSTLSSLYLQRSPIRWRKVYAGLPVQFVTDLPRYPLSPSTFIVPFKETSASTKIEENRPPRPLYKFLDGSQKVSANGSIFRSRISDLAEFIKSHNVGGAPLCPASVYIELALEALNLAKLDPHQLTRFRTIRELSFDSPLVYSEGRNITISTELAADGSHFRVRSEGGSLHCTGFAAKTTDLAITQGFARRTSYIKRQRASVNFVDSFSTRILYDVVFPRVVAYSGPYVTIKQFNIAASGLEGAGTFQIPRSDGVFACPPAFTDTLLHAAGFVANSKIGTDEACICVKVERVTIPNGGGQDETLYNREIGVYCGLVECSEEDAIIGDAYALDESGNVIACVEGMHFKRLRLKSFQAHLARALKPASMHHQQEQKATARVRKDSGPGSELQSIPAHHSSMHVAAMPSNRSLDRESVRSSIRPTLHGSLSDLCGTAAADIDDNARLSEMGVDSLLFIELTATLQQRFPHLNLSGPDFSSCDTVQDVEKVLEKAAAGTSTPQFEIAPANFVPQPAAAPPSVDIARIDDFFQEVCGFSMQQMDKDATMDSLGVDSLLSIELVTGLRQTFGIELDQNTISSLTIREIEKAVSGSSSTSHVEHAPRKQQHLPTTNDYHGIPPEQKLVGHAPTTILGMDTFPVHLQKADSADRESSPLYLFHDGSGLCNVYSRLGKLGRDVYGIFSLDFSHVDRKITTLEELADRYINQAKLMDHDNLILGGWSFGGVLAFEVSRQLRRRQGKRPEVLGVALLDSPHPIAHEPLPEAVISHVCGQMPGHTPAMRQIRGAIEAQFHRNAQLLGRYNPVPTDGDGDDDARCVMLKCSSTFDAEAVCGVPYPWLSNDVFRADSVKLWESLVGAPVPTLDVRGNHFDLFAPDNVEHVSTQLKRACQMLEEKE